jgi:hypothetical protein
LPLCAGELLLQRYAAGFLEFVLLFELLALLQLFFEEQQLFHHLIPLCSDLL